MELDRLDLAILDHLQANGRATAQDLGEAAHLSASPSHRRQKLLEEERHAERVLTLRRVGATRRRVASDDVEPGSEPPDERESRPADD